MSRPYSDEEITSEQQIIDDAKRFAKMFGGLIKIGEHLAPVVSLKRACNEADTRLVSLRDEEEKLKASVDFHKMELSRIQDETSKATNERHDKLDEINKQIALREEDLRSLLEKRENFLKSIGAK